MATTLFDVGDIVYLKASALRGFLEPYQITKINTEDSTFIYVVQTTPIPQRSISSGNYLSHTESREIGFYGDQLIRDKFEAISLAISFHESQILYLNSLLG
jgi:hypothetical protein